VQPTLYHSNDETDALIDKMLKQSRSQAFNCSVLVIMNTLVHNRAHVDRALSEIAADADAILRSDGIRAAWAVTIVLESNLTEQAALQSYVASKTQASRIESVGFRVVAREGRFSKWALLTNYLSRLPQFDRVLLKDSDQRLAGFPWATFVEKKGKAVIAGALRQSVDEGLIRTRLADGFLPRQYFQYNNAGTWKRSRAQEYLQVQAQPVNFVEQYFVLLDTKFASYFFGRILAKKYEIASSWGPDAMWCGAAHEWLQMEEQEQAAGSALTAGQAGTRQPCVLVPLVTNHEDTRQIQKTDGDKNSLIASGMSVFSKDFKEWLAYSKGDRKRFHMNFGWVPGAAWNAPKKAAEAAHASHLVSHQGSVHPSGHVSRSVQRNAGQPCNPGAAHGIQQMCPGETPCPTCGDGVLKCRCPSEARLDQ
jgi:hypothetical protein